MNSSMRPVLVVGLMVLVVAASEGISEWRAAHAVEVIPWRFDLSTAQAEARKSHRPVFAYFTAAWCGPCKRMKSTTWADNTVRDAMEKFVPVKIDVDAQATVARQFGVDSMPTYLIFSENGELLRRLSGMMPPEQMVGWLER